MDGYKRSASNNGVLLTNDPTGYEQALKQNRLREKRKNQESVIAMLVARINDIENRLRILEQKFSALTDK